MQWLCSELIRTGSILVLDWKGEVRKGFCGMHGEHSDHHIDYDFQFGFIGCSTFNEDVCRVD